MGRLICHLGALGVWDSDKLHSLLVRLEITVHWHGSMYDHPAVVGFENGKCKVQSSIANLARHCQSSRSDGNLAATAENIIRTFPVYIQWQLIQISTREICCRHLSERLSPILAAGSASAQRISRKEMSSLSRIFNGTK